MNVYKCLALLAMVIACNAADGKWNKWTKLPKKNKSEKKTPFETTCVQDMQFQFTKLKYRWKRCGDNDGGDGTVFEWSDWSDKLPKKMLQKKKMMGQTPCINGVQLKWRRRRYKTRTCDGAKTTAGPISTDVPITDGPSNTDEPVTGGPPNTEEPSITEAPVTDGPSNTDEPITDGPSNFADEDKAVNGKWSKWTKLPKKNKSERKKPYETPCVKDMQFQFKRRQYRSKTCGNDVDVSNVWSAWSNSTKVPKKMRQKKKMMGLTACINGVQMRWRFRRYKTRVCGGEPNTTAVPVTTGQPITDEPSITEAPVTDGPSITEAPVTDGPSITEEPVTEGPSVTEEPVTEGPSVTEEPVTEGPSVTEEPVTEGPTITDAPVTDGPDPTTDGGDGGDGSDYGPWSECVDGQSKSCKTENGITSCMIKSCISGITAEGSPASNAEQACLDKHNEYRRAHGKSELQWSSTIAESARQWAQGQSQGAGSDMKHSEGTGFGENLAWASGLNDGQQEGSEAVKRWYDEICLYDSCDNYASSGTGHFTQAVWSDSEYLGCAVVNNANGLFTVAQYYPPGNYKDEYCDKVGLPTENPLLEQKCNTCGCATKK